MADELDHKPFDRELLDRFAAMFDADDTVCDMGCGPAHVARYVSRRGVKVRLLISFHIGDEVLTVSSQSAKTGG